MHVKKRGLVAHRYWFRGLQPEENTVAIVVAGMAQEKFAAVGAEQPARAVAFVRAPYFVATLNKIRIQSVLFMLDGTRGDSNKCSCVESWRGEATSASKRNSYKKIDTRRSGHHHAALSVAL